MAGSRFRLRTRVRHGVVICMGIVLVSNCGGGSVCVLIPEAVTHTGFSEDVDWSQGVAFDLVPDL
jgi:hypothetical protein